MFWRSVCVVALATATLACSEPPTKERQQAEGAIAAARAAGAATYAVVELKAAEDALVEYDAAVQQRDYRQALRLALEARNGAYDAAKRAADEKAAARGRAEQLAARLDVLVRAAATRQVPASRAAAERARATQKSAATALQKARSLIDQQAYADAIAMMTPFIEALSVPPVGGPAAAPRRTP